MTAAAEGATEAPAAKAEKVRGRHPSTRPRTHTTLITHPWDDYVT
jgi:hypothetical protein